MANPARVLPLLAGLVLGAAAVRFVRPFAIQTPAPSPAPAGAGSHASAGPSSSGPVTGSAAGLLLPPLLAGAEADAALDAYLALPPLAKDASTPAIEERLDRLRALLTLLPDSHFGRLFATLATRVGDPEVRLRRAAFDVWVEHDAPAAARWALAIVPGEPINAPARQRYLTQATLAWAETDFAVAYAWSTGLGDAKLVRAVAGQLLAQLAATDPQRALALAQAGGGDFFAGTRVALFSAWAKKDPATALQTLGPVILEKSPDDEWEVQHAVVRWAGLDPRAALDWMLAQPPDHDDPYRSILASSVWNLAENPGTARAMAEMLRSRDDIPVRSDLLSRLVGSWVRKDTASALAWIDTLPDAAQRNDLISNAVDQLSYDRPDAAPGLILRLPPGDQRDAQLAAHVVGWAEHDPDAALAWLHAHDEPELAAATRQVEGRLIAQAAATDPAAAIARWQTLPEGEAKAFAGQFLAVTWAKNDPAAAAGWLESHFDPAKTGESLQLVAERWACTDPLGLVRWAGTLTDKNQAAIALRGLDGVYGQSGGDWPDPPRRAEYADLLARIEAPSLRESALSNHLRQWMRSDLPAARAWIEAHDVLSPEATARLLIGNEVQN